MTDITLSGSLELIVTQATPKPEVQCFITARYRNFTATAKGFHMASELPIDNYAQYRVDYKDKNENPAKVQTVVWAVSDTAIATVVQDSTDPQLCTVTPAGSLGDIQLTATADVDLDVILVKNLVTTLDISVIAGQAISGVITQVGSNQPITQRVEPAITPTDTSAPVDPAAAPAAATA